ncbi:hypothetical protein [Proteus hauseri]|uniref:hypothetical protein n=1 Tax=Proteus hauseri TaxID=183417 RepID=UPI0032DB1A0E
MRSTIEKDVYTPYFASQIAVLAVFYALIVFCAIMLANQSGDDVQSIKGFSLIIVAVLSYLFVINRVGILVTIILNSKSFSKKDKVIRTLELCLIILAVFITPFYTFAN